MDAHQSAATHDDKMPSVLLQQSVLARVEEVRFRLCGEHAPSVEASSTPVKKTDIRGASVKVLVRVRIAGRALVHVLVPVGGSVGLDRAEGACARARVATLINGRAAGAHSDGWATRRREHRLGRSAIVLQRAEHGIRHSD